MFSKLLQNTCKPKGIAGKIVLKIMNAGHDKLSDWGLSHILIKENYQWSNKIKGMKVYGIPELVKLLKESGFSIEKIEQKQEGKCICIVSRKK